MANVTLSRLIDHLLPSYCHLCIAPCSGLLCDNCLKALPTYQGGCCQCDIPIPIQGDRCGECLKYPPAVDQVLCGFLYRDPLPHIIHQLKDHWGTAWLELLTSPLSKRIQSHYDLDRSSTASKTPKPQSSPSLIPVPLHWSRRFIRGYNQSECIAAILAKQFELPLIRPFKKIKHTASQHTLNRKQRFRNLKETFALTTPVSGDHLILVDDVMTTGATLNILAEQLKRKGVKKVDAWVLARTPKPTLG